MQLFLDYVLFHFKRLYHLPEPLEISYGPGGQGRVQVQQTSSKFFEQKQAQPEHVGWKEWKGTLLPLFFNSNTEQEWFTADAQQNVLLHFDLIASSFYLLSGWQEFYGNERDKFGRYPYQASVQAKYGLVTKPVVNYYFEILREAAEKAYGQKVMPKFQWSGKPFATCLTHDIDYLQSAWKVAGKPALLKGNLPLFLKLALRRATGADAWFNLRAVEEELRRLEAKGTFFFLPEKKKIQGYPNADYDITAPKIKAEINRLTTSGHEIGLHGSHGTGANPGQLQAEKRKIDASVTGNRFHYLRFDPALSVSILEANGLGYDSSLGFAEHFGFRNSYCHPFRMFDFQHQRRSEVWQLPLNVMDVTLHHPNYLQLLPEQVLPALTPMLAEIKKFRGVFTLLWHNENLSAYGLPSGLSIFREITSYLQQEETFFVTGTQALAQN